MVSILDSHAKIVSSNPAAGSKIFSCKENSARRQAENWEKPGTVDASLIKNKILVINSL